MDVFPVQLRTWREWLQKATDGIAALNNEQRRKRPKAAHRSSYLLQSLHPTLESKLWPEIFTHLTKQVYGKRAP